MCDHVRKDHPRNFLLEFSFDSIQPNLTSDTAYEFQVSWDPPQEVFGILKEYTVYYGIQSPTVSPVNSVKVSPADRSIILESNFEANSTYNFWVSLSFFVGVKSSSQ